MRAALTLTALLAASPGCVDASAAPATTTVRAEDDLKRVFFSRSSARIRAEGRRSLDQNVAILKEHPRVDVVIVGHADDARSAARWVPICAAREPSWSTAASPPRLAMSCRCAQAPSRSSLVRLST